ncbi:porimin-like [Megalops cyprinoides]|uniref:porimin-like n=1 Tax=Megalops cyprinoides TaxID=118141 RepID=UPI0018650AD9|nr:porimin-like [Megalops cyprinoides]
MAFKALRLFTSAALLASYSMIFVSSEMEALQRESNATNGTTLATMTMMMTTKMLPTNVGGLHSPASNVTRGSTIATSSQTKSRAATTSQKPVHSTTGVTSTTAYTCASSTFHAVSFFGGIVLTLVVTLTVFLGYRFSCSKPEVRYRAIEEHEAII